MINLPNADITALMGVPSATPEQGGQTDGTASAAFLEIMTADVVLPEPVVNGDVDAFDASDMPTDPVPVLSESIRPLANIVPATLIALPDVAAESGVSFLADSSDMLLEYVNKPDIRPLDLTKPATFVAPELVPNTLDTPALTGLNADQAKPTAPLAPEPLVAPMQDGAKVARTPGKSPAQTPETQVGAPQVFRSSVPTLTGGEILNSTVIAESASDGIQNVQQPDGAVAVPPDMAKVIALEGKDSSFVIQPRKAQIIPPQRNAADPVTTHANDTESANAAPVKSSQKSQQIAAAHLIQSTHIPESGHAEAGQLRAEKQAFVMPPKSGAQVSPQRKPSQVKQHGLIQSFPTESARQQAVIPPQKDPDRTVSLGLPKEVRKIANEPTDPERTAQTTDIVAPGKPQKTLLASLARPPIQMPDQQIVDRFVPSQPDAAAEPVSHNRAAQRISQSAAQSTQILSADMAATILQPAEVAMPDALDSLETVDLTSTEARHIETASARIETVVSRPEIPRHVARQLADVARQMPDRPVELILNPDELGRVRLTFTLTDGGINVAVLAERGETMDLMRRHIETLAQEFRDMGYSDVKFQFSQNGQGESGGGNSTPDRNPAENLSQQETETITPAKLTLEPPAGLDLRL